MTVNRNVIASVIDLLASPMVLVAAMTLKAVRKLGVQRMPVSRKIFSRVGVFPIEDHYYEPLFNPVHLNESFAAPRELPAINWNRDGQFGLIEQLATYSKEIPSLPNTSFSGA